MSFISENRTASVLLIVMFVYFVISEFISKRWFKLFYTFSKSFLIISPITFIFYIYFQEPLELLDPSLHSRYTYIHRYFSNIDWYNFLLPIFNEPRLIFQSMHNEMLEVFNASSLFGFVSYYLIIITQLEKFSVKYHAQGISLILLIFVGSTMVQATLHMYMAVVMAYILSFYVVLSENID